MVRSAHVTALIAVVALPLLAGCTAVEATPPPAVVAHTSTPTATPTPTPTASADVSAAPGSTSVPPAAAPSPSVSVAASHSAAGCTNGHAAIPAGARTEQIADVDGDGRNDTAFLTTSKPWELGVATAAGGVFTTADRLPSSGEHHVWTVGTDGFPGRAVVLDDGLVATVLSIQDCGIRAVTTPDGAALMIPIGAHAASGNATTGVACNDQNGGILIEAVQLRARSDGRYDVAWSTLEPGGSFSPATVRYAGLAASDARVARARTSTCWAAHTLTVTH